MKKLVLLISLIAISLEIQAATSGTLYLRGFISEVLSIVVTPTTQAQALDLSVTANNLKVASITETTNSSSPYRIKISSLNKGSLNHGNGVSSVPYTITYNSQNFNLQTDALVSFVGTEGTETRTEVRDLGINYTGVNPSQFSSGQYTDTLTVTIEAE